MDTPQPGDVEKAELYAMKVLLTCLTRTLLDTLPGGPALHAPRLMAWATNSVEAFELHASASKTARIRAAMQAEIEQMIMPGTSQR